MKFPRPTTAISLAFIILALVACGPAQQPQSQSGLTVEEARQISKDAYLYGFPLATNYQTMYKQAIDTSNSDYRAPFNVLASSAGVATPEDKFVVTPNSDTPYSYLWMDLRAEPVVVTMPKIEKNRYYTGQLIDLYTFNFAYLGTRSFGNDGGVFMITGPGWSGDSPKGIKATFHSDTEFAYLLFRTQLFNPADLANVKKIQSGYKAEPLNKFLARSESTSAPAVSWPKPTDGMLTSPALFPYVNFILQFCPTDPSEKDLMARFAKLDIGAGRTFDISKFSPEIQKAINEGIADAGTDMAVLMKKINADEVSSSDFFGN